MSRAVKRTDLAAEFVADVGIDKAAALVEKPPVHWFVRGPRGGLYMATGTIGRRIASPAETMDEWFYISEKGHWSVIDHSEGTSYIRPGSRLYRMAVEAGQ